MDNWVSVEKSIKSLIQDEMDRVHIQSIHGLVEPLEIENQLNEFCSKYLNGKIEGCSYSYISVGSTFVIKLSGGGILVIKVHGDDRDIDTLLSTCDIEHKLALEGFPCPYIIVPPVEFGRCIILAMEYRDQGEIVDGHDPRIRRAIAENMADLIAITKRNKFEHALPSWLTGGSGLWPKPHNVLFDFSKEFSETRIIDEIGTYAKSILLKAPGEQVIAHSDMAIQNIAFRDGIITSVFDWDSLRCGSEMFFVGAASHTFPYDWRRDEEPVLTTPEEVRAFIGEYEAGRGRSFSKEELKVVHSSMVYSMGYGARCKISLNPERYDIVERLMNFEREFLAD